MKFKRKLVVGALFSASLTFSGVSAAVGFTSTFKGTWEYIDIPNVYDYAPTAMMESDGDWSTWHCGYGSATDGDVIMYTRIGSGGVEVSTTAVLAPEASDSAFDSRHTCAPSAFKHSHSAIYGGQELYKLYYECAAKFYDIDTGSLVEGFTQICHAASLDGINWYKYNADLWSSIYQFGDTPTPVISVSDQIITNTAYDFSDGKHKIDHDLFDGGRDYGVGHPTVVVQPNNEIWLWYYDSTGVWGDRGIYLAKSWDGFNFGTPIKTKTTGNPSLPVQNPMDIRYFPSLGKYVGQMVIDGNSAFAYSTDGITWTWPNTASLAAPGGALHVGETVADQCGAGGQSSVVADKKGNAIVAADGHVNIISQQGKYGPDDNGYQAYPTCYVLTEPMRGSTWALYIHQGKFQ